MKNCIHCKDPNPEQWFYCRKCGKKASDVKFTTNMYMMSEVGKRSDIEFSTTTLDNVIEKDIKERKEKNTQFWSNAVKEGKKRYA